MRSDERKDRQMDGRTGMTQRTGVFHGYADPPKDLIILGRLAQKKSDIYIYTVYMYITSQKI